MNNEEGTIINLQDQCLESYDFYYSDFKNKKTTIILFDLLHPKLIQKGNNSYLVFDGCLEQMPKNSVRFFFAQKTFQKTLMGSFDIYKFKASEKVRIKFDVKRTGYFLELTDFFQLKN